MRSVSLSPLSHPSGGRPHGLSLVVYDPITIVFYRFYVPPCCLALEAPQVWPYGAWAKLRGLQCAMSNDQCPKRKHGGEPNVNGLLQVGVITHVHKSTKRNGFSVLVKPLTSHAYHGSCAAERRLSWRPQGVQGHASRHSARSWPRCWFHVQDQPLAASADRGRPLRRPKRSQKFPSIGPVTRRSLGEEGG